MNIGQTNEYLGVPKLRGYVVDIKISNSTSNTLLRIKSFVIYIFCQIKIFFTKMYDYFFSATVKCSEDTQQEKNVDTSDKILAEAFPIFNKCDEQDQSSIRFNFDIESQEQKDNITTLIHTLSNDSYVSLLLRQQELKSLGHEIDEDVDPLSFLAFIVNTSKTNLQKIIMDPFLGGNFLDGASRKLQAYHDRYDISSKLDSYSDKVNVNRDLLNGCVHAVDWNRFIRLVAGLDE